MRNGLIHCSEAHSIFTSEDMLQKSEAGYSGNWGGIISVSWLMDIKNNIDKSPRSYQREFVTKEEIRDGVLRTIFQKGMATVPGIHVRAITKRTGDGTIGVLYEVIDGQQRVTSISNFINDIFVTPRELFFRYGDISNDISNMYCSEIKEKYPSAYEYLLQYYLSCTWYVGSDEETADLFVNVLNNTNIMNYQEKRNAIRGGLSDFIRDAARPIDGKQKYPLLECIAKGDKREYKWMSVGTNNRMEMDEWVAIGLFWWLANNKNFENGVNQNELTEWTKEVQRPGGKYANGFNDVKKAEEFFKYGYSLLKEVDKIHRRKVSPMAAHILIFFAKRLESMGYKINKKVFVNYFFEIYDKWNDVKKPLYASERMANGKESMPQFSKLFVMRNSSRIKTILMVMDRYVKSDAKKFGLTPLDNRAGFSSNDIYQRLLEQGGMDYFTGTPLDIFDAEGDHYIPRSYGIDEGGVTEYKNLVVTSRSNNNAKSNIHGDDFLSEYFSKRPVLKDLDEHLKEFPKNKKQEISDDTENQAA